MNTIIIFTSVKIIGMYFNHFLNKQENAMVKIAIKHCKNSSGAGCVNQEGMVNKSTT
jgi:hypothetical protein